jgi:hypothetical protein
MAVYSTGTGKMHTCAKVIILRQYSVRVCAEKIECEADENLKGARVIHPGEFSTFIILNC